MLNDKQIKDIAKLLTDDPDIFLEAKKGKKMDEVEVDDEFEDHGDTHKDQKEPREPGKATHKTSDGPDGVTGK